MQLCDFIYAIVFNIQLHECVRKGGFSNIFIPRNTLGYFLGLSICSHPPPIIKKNGVDTGIGIVIHIGITICVGNTDAYTKIYTDIYADTYIDAYIDTYTENILIHLYRHLLPHKCVFPKIKIKMKAHIPINVRN